MGSDRVICEACQNSRAIPVFSLCKISRLAVEGATGNRTVSFAFERCLWSFTQPGPLRYNVLYFPIKKILRGTKKSLGAPLVVTENIYVLIPEYLTRLNIEYKV